MYSVYRENTLVILVCVCIHLYIHIQYMCVCIYIHTYIKAVSTLYYMWVFLSANMEGDKGSTKWTSIKHDTKQDAGSNIKH